LVGLSNGAFFAERLARHALLDLLAIALVSGTAREASHRLAPTPLRPCAVLMIAGTADPNVPYAGGRARGLTGWMARRRISSVLSSADGRDAVAAEALGAEWAGVNGANGRPVIDIASAEAADLRVELLSWPAGASPVDLYRVIGGGHGWPGRPQYAPRFLIGPVSRAFDTTGAVLDFVRALTS
ncbi:MAG TPA: hypothetical protein VJN67_20390, partial [Stellaceae bacterium]|nr:hypothetical protein [Stellaceae bacterium]